MNKQEKDMEDSGVSVPEQEQARTLEQSEIEHLASAECPCRPVVVYTDPVTGARVFRHNTKEQLS